MSTLAHKPTQTPPSVKPSQFPSAKTRVPPLENGSHLSAKEFLRRYEAMPDLKKAELIDGKVYVMASPVCASQHAEPDAFVQTWLGTYALSTKKCRT